MGCGNEADTLTAPPARVPVETVPARLEAGDLAVIPYEGEDAVEAFAEAGDLALVADGRIWEIRQGEILVGVLQLSTVKPRVDLTTDEHRSAIIRSIMPGGVRRIEVDGVTVSYTESQDQVRYVWFGREAFAVLTLKGTRVEEEAILREVLEYQVASQAWKPLPGEDARNGT